MVNNRNQLWVSEREGERELSIFKVPADFSLLTIQDPRITIKIEMRHKYDLGVECDNEHDKIQKTVWL